MFTRALRLQRLQSTPLVAMQQRCFRQTFVNPYKDDPTPMKAEEREAQVAKPVWDRVFDHQRYMKHEGPLKLSTGIAYLDVEPFPRMKLMKLYYLALQELNELPDEYGYKFLSRELTRFRMKVVDENLQIRDIENKISAGLVEELIFQAHNEIKLLRIMKKWQPWKHFAQTEPDMKELLHNFASFRHDNPFPTVFENYDNMRHDKTKREKY